MISSDRPTARVHLRAAAIALAVAGLCLGGAVLHVRGLEQRYLPIMATESSRVKDLGIVWQKESFSRKDELPLYGSSELIKRAPNKASQFFAQYPTGFAVSPVGRASCTSLILLEKLAASAKDAHGRKVVLSVSPSWFVVKGANHDGFNGNFSTMQASELFFSTPLSLELKHSIAASMLRYPEAFDKNLTLAVAARALAGNRWCDRLLYFATVPLGRLQDEVFSLQDHYELLAEIQNARRRGRVPKHVTRPLDWDALLASSEQQVRPLPPDVRNARLREFTGDGMFLQALQHSYEWGDFELLLRTARELGLEPLVLSMPMEYEHFERMGLSPQSIDAYTWRLREFSKRYEVPVVDFVDLGEDPGFFADHFGHPSAKGWIYMDRALDDFYHGRTPRQSADLPASVDKTSSPRTDRLRLLPSGPWSETPGT